jgi:hypothetical protein
MREDSLDEVVFTPNPKAQAIWNDLVDQVFDFLPPVPRQILRSATATLLTDDYISIVAGDIVLMGLINDYYSLISGYLWELGLSLDLIFDAGEPSKDGQGSFWPVDIHKGRRGHLRAV